MGGYGGKKERRNDKMEWLKEILKDEENGEELYERIGGEIKKRWGDNEKSAQEYEKEIEALKNEISSAKRERIIEKEIEAQGGRNTKAIRALIDEDMIETDEEGNIISIDMEKIKKSDPYLFKEIKKAVEGTPENKGGRRKSERNVFFESAKKAAGIKE